MAKIRITSTNGASAEDISAAIDEFLKDQEKKEKKEKKDSDSSDK